MTIKLDHINLSVTNLQQSIEWYKKIFGFELVEAGTTSLGIQWGIVAFDDTMICMTEYSERTLADQFDDKSVHQIYHFGLRISDANQWRNIIQENNLKLYYGGEIAYPSSKSWYIHDPSGHEIEVSYAIHGILQFPKINT